MSLYTDIAVNDGPDAGRQKINTGFKNTLAYLEGIAGPNDKVLLDAVGNPNIFCRVSLRNWSIADGFDALEVTGTAQAGAASNITLASGASASDDKYNGRIIEITAGTGSGQFNLVTDYTGSSKDAAVKTAWTTQPDGTSVYKIYACHPAFFVNGSVVNEIWIGKYQAIVADTSDVILTDTNPTSSNTPARSGNSHTNIARVLPGYDPFVKGDYDYVKKASENMNGGGITGYHLMSFIEGSLLALIGYEMKLDGIDWLKGNTNYGKDESASHRVGVMAPSHNYGGPNPGRILGGSMPDSELLGMFDLKGNVREWGSGFKIINGVAYIAGDANVGPSGPGNSFEASEANYFNTGVDITAGITNSDKITSLRTDPELSGFGLPGTVDATGSANFDYADFLFNASGTYYAKRGRIWNNGTDGGLFAADIQDAKTQVNWGNGFRPAFIGDLSTVT